MSQIQVHWGTAALPAVEERNKLVSMNSFLFEFLFISSLMSNLVKYKLNLHVMHF